MKKNLKRVIAMLLTVVMLVGFVPMTGISASAASYTGKCGDNLTWSLDTTKGELVISGTGPMYDYIWHDYPLKNVAPWYDYLNKIYSVTINNGVTSIGNSAFAYSKVKNITIPDTVTSIGDSVFSNCYSLTSVTIPDSVTSIDSSAFYCCTSLTSVTIGDGVTNIGDFAFCCCKKLTSVTIPDGVTSIGNQAFSDCTSLVSITIGKGVTSIGNRAFEDCASLVSVTIGKGVTSISDSAFQRCSALENVYYTGDVAGWCEISFSDNTSNPLFYADNLYIDRELVTELVIPDGVTNIKKNAFHGLTGLTSVTIPDSVKSINHYAFAYCTSLTEATIGKGITFVALGAFGGCDNLEEVIFTGSGAVDLSLEAFNGSPKAMICCEENSWLHSYADLNDLRVCVFDKNGVPSFELKNDMLISYRGNATDVYVNSGTKVGYGAFENNKTVKKVEISSAINRIYNDAFKNCTALRTVIIPQSVTSIGDDAFEGCKDVTIYGYAGSYAESYAKQKGIKFEYITLNVSADTYAVNVLDTLQLEASYNILLNDDENIIWSCDDNGVASVSQTGEVTALKAGEAVVTATSENGLYATCVIKVEDSGNTRGDLNGDGIANSTDALIILQHTVGKITIDEKLIPFADVNDDNFVNSTDALKILQFTVGKINKL